MKTIVLIGMPGTGKSTVGVLLAKALGMGFVDTDILIQLREKRTLQDIIQKSSYLALREIEEQVVLENHYVSKVVATGGSVVHSVKSMAKLKQAGKIIYLSCSIAQLRDRIHDFDARGIAAPIGQGLTDIAIERTTLYEKFGDCTFDTSFKPPAEIVQEIMQSGLCK
jgi:shikimate kinase